jgi:hypothetical protein
MGEEMKIYGYIAAGLIIIGFIVWYSDNQYDAGYNTAKAEYEESLRASQAAMIEETNRQQKMINVLTDKWLAEKKNVKTVYETIEKEVPVYVQDNRKCDLTRGAVSLLNQAGDPKQLQKDYHPPITHAESRTTSTITQRAQFKNCIRWGEQYNDLADRFDTLINTLKAQGL